ncbi:hypothetical protein O181_069077 [Austropuccinia psidii MF-1]|uniref:Uncharacterized protein n=1 Tax=Austropuccinia psidii MF-1 TaxID=1389203 RepID=A0A9Q3I6X5_9BASI|nr:hypothetical protein [Austropuccinia psidii MF-1]
MSVFRDLLQTVVTPRGASRPPSNLGCAKHGKLKAVQWLCLFTLILPLIIPEMYIERRRPINVNSIRGKFLQNIGDLVQCTQIIRARVLRSGHAGRFANEYKRYTISSKEIFNNPKVKPNNHYALHIPKQLILWGPMFGVGEFAGKQAIGLLQKVSTNGRIEELHGTLMKKALQTQRLLGSHKRVMNRLDAKDTMSKCKGHHIKVGDLVYTKMISLIERNGGKVRIVEDFPHPEGSWILSQFAITSRSVCFGEEEYLQKATTMAPNTLVVYKFNGNFEYGLVKGIYHFQGRDSSLVTGIYLTQISQEYSRPKYSPGHIGYYLQLLGVTVGNICTTTLMISPQDVISLAAYQLFENDVFRATSDGTIISPANRLFHSLHSQTSV